MAILDKTIFTDVLYVSDGKMRRADIVVEGEYIAKVTDKEEVRTEELGLKNDEYSLQSSIISHRSSIAVLLPGVIDDHVHTREPGLTHKGDLCTESHAAAAGGVTSVMDMPNVVPQTTTLEALAERQRMGKEHAFVNYAFHFGATNSNADLLPLLDPTAVSAVKLFMGSSTGGMLVDHGNALEAVFQRSPLPIMVHCEDSAIIADNMRRAQALYGNDPDVVHHAGIRSREACIASSKEAIRLAVKYGKQLHIAHVTTKEELSLPPSLLQRGEDANSQKSCFPLFEREGVPDRAGVSLEACVAHLLFTDEDYRTLGTRIKCNPAVKTRADREALRAALTDGRIAVVGTDHAPHLLAEKEGGCKRAASGMPMVQFSLAAMLGLAEEGVLSITRLVELMCHNPARLFGLRDRGFIREGMKADLVVVRREPWTLTPDKIVSRCGWSPLEGRTFPWQVEQTYCNGRLIYNKGVFAEGNQHAQALHFARDGAVP